MHGLITLTTTDTGDELSLFAHYICAMITHMDRPPNGDAPTFRCTEIVTVAGRFCVRETKAEIAGRVAMTEVRAYPPSMTEAEQLAETLGITTDEVLERVRTVLTHPPDTSALTEDEINELAANA